MLLPSTTVKGYVCVPATSGKAKTKTIAATKTEASISLLETKSFAAHSS
jgi:hypothetical protein